MMKKVGMVIVLSGLLLSCKKERAAGSCSRLQTGIEANNSPQVSAALASIISALPDRAYTAANLEQLAQRLSADCSLNVQVVCFDCIKTLPSASEIRVSVSGSRSKVLDISYSAANQMEFRGMHN